MKGYKQYFHNQPTIFVCFIGLCLVFVPAVLNASDIYVDQSYGNDSNSGLDWDYAKKTILEFNRLDVLVNNAGRTMWTTLEDLVEPSIIDQLMRINYFGAAYCTYYALSHLKKSKGRIVGISSLAGLNGVPTRTAYSATKHAMFGFFDSLRIELLGTGVTVTMIAPDFVLSEIHRRAFGKDGKPLGSSPLQEDKVMTADECASRIIKAMEDRDRLAILSFRGKLGRWMKLIAPGFIDQLALKAIRDAK